MRTFLLAVAIATFGAVPAYASPLHLKRLATSDAPPVTSAKSGGMAYLLSSTSLRVRRTGQPARAYTVPEGCRPGAMGAGVVALTCWTPASADSPSHFKLSVLREADGVVVQVAAPPGVSYDSTSVEVGRHWLLAHGNRSGDTRQSRRFLIQWSTGRATEIAGYLFGDGASLEAAEYYNPDAREPVRRLCEPITRTGDSADPILRVGRWVWQYGAVQRCGSSRVIGSRHWVRLVLGRDALAYLVNGRIVYRDLRSDRRRTGPRPNRAPAHLAMFGRRLVVFDSVTQYAGPYRIYLGPREP